MRPFALADAWREPRLSVLRMFVYATRVGLLDLEWDVICPNCRGATTRAVTLSDLADDAHCTSCNIRYDVNFDEAVELRFSVNPDIRDAVDMPYCIGGPANTRHIMSQLWLPPLGAKELRLRVVEGAYRLRSRQLPSVASLNVAAISNSYGGSDTPDDPAYNHPGILITASTGDNGYGVSSPATYSHVVRASKPHAVIFDIACRDHGLVPAETFFIDDLLPNIEAAREFGFRSHHYHHDRHHELLAELQQLELI